MSALVSWWACVVRYEAREGWRWLPGPWPVKLLALAVLGALQLIPGQVDDLLFIAALGAFRKRQARKALAEAS